MKIAIAAFLFTEWNMKINSCHLANVGTICLGNEKFAVCL